MDQIRRGHRSAITRRTSGLPRSVYGCWIRRRRHASQRSGTGEGHRVGSVPAANETLGGHRLRHSAVHGQYHQSGEEQTRQQAELYVPATAQKMIAIPDVLGQRHHQHQQRRQKHEQLTRRPIPLARVGCPSAIEPAANGSQRLLLHPLLSQDASGIDPQIQTDTLAMACRAVGRGCPCFNERKGKIQCP